jgi:hypothetical protein
LYLETAQLGRELWFGNQAMTSHDSGRLERFPNGVVKRRPNLPDKPALPVWPGAVAQKGDSNLGFQVDPEGATAESKMPDRSRGKMPARR